MRKPRGGEIKIHSTGGNGNPDHIPAHLSYGRAVPSFEEPWFHYTVTRDGRIYDRKGRDVTDEETP